jgi:hypothetical protein
VHFDGIVIKNVNSLKERNNVKSKFKADKKGARLQLEQVFDATPQHELYTMSIGMAKAPKTFYN